MNLINNRRCSVENNPFIIYYIEKWGVTPVKVVNVVKVRFQINRINKINNIAPKVFSLRGEAV
jgi:hypothetical protein